MMKMVKTTKLVGDVDGNDRDEVVVLSQLRILRGEHSEKGNGCRASACPPIHNNKFVYVVSDIIVDRFFICLSFFFVTAKGFSH